MAGHLVDLPLILIGSLIEPSDEWEKHRCMLLPDAHVTIPEIFGIIILAVDPGKLCSQGVHLGDECLVLDSPDHSSFSLLYSGRSEDAPLRYTILASLSFL